MSSPTKMASPESAEPARKRQKLSPPTSGPVEPSTSTSSSAITTQPEVDAETESNMAHFKMIAERTTGFHSEKEANVGILKFVNEVNPGFTGILKQRYTDFLVNEITPDGNVVHLRSITIPRQRKQPNEAAKQLRRQSRAASELEESIDALIQSAVASVDISLLASQPVTEKTAISTRVHVESSVASSTLAVSKSANESANGKPIFTLPPDDEILMDSYFGPETRDLIVKLYMKILQKPDAKPGTMGSVFSEPVTDRARRTLLHRDIRRIFNEKLETSADALGVIKLSAALKPRQPKAGSGAVAQRDNDPVRQKGKLGWQDLGGQFLHFSLYKENKDTMEVIAFIAARLKMRPKSFAFAGTKDRRGVTVQRVSVFRVPAEQLVSLNSSLFNSRIGDFKYEKHGLELGELDGNEFLITLRDCRFPGDEDLNDNERVALAKVVVGDALKSLQEHGFINYYGLQRFGTYLVGTEQIGMRILQNRFKEAIDFILSYSEGALASALNPGIAVESGKQFGRDDIARAHALFLFATTAKSSEALNKMPRKFNAEIAIIKHLSHWNRRTDYAGALLSINRNLKLMYVHAYQSLVWNMVASRRWELFGNRVIEGDLVLVDQNQSKSRNVVQPEEVDQNGEIVVLPAADDVAISQDDIFQRARPITSDEAASGKFTIFDIVLPTPGYDIEYPNNEIGDYYKEFMGTERGGFLDPGNMRRSHKDFSLSGSYRKLMAGVGNDVTYEIKAYQNDYEQMVVTDLDKIKAKYHKQQGRDGQLNRTEESSSKASGPSNKKNYAQGHAEGKVIQEANVERHNEWKNLSTVLEAEDKVSPENADWLAAEAASAKVLGIPSFKDTYLETSAKNGELTGRHETTVVSGTTDAAMSGTDSLVLEGQSEVLKRALPSVISLTSTESSDPDEGGGAPVYADENGVYGYRASPRDATFIFPSAKPLPRLTRSTVSSSDSLESIARTDSTSTGSPDMKRKRPSEEALGSSHFKIEAPTSAPKQVQESSPTIGDVEMASAPLSGDEIMDNMTGTVPAHVDSQLKTDDPTEKVKETKIAVIVKFQLGSSQYATMALRELMKQGGVQTFQPDFTN